MTAGNNATFTVAASGTAPLTYQWKFNGSPIGGATSASYTVTNAQNANAGNYSVDVSNSVNTATSNSVSLTVNAASGGTGRVLCEVYLIQPTAAAAGATPAAGNGN